MDLFTIVPIFIGVVFVIVIATIIFQAAKGIAEWSHNNRQPVLSVPARVVSKRTATSGLDWAKVVQNMPRAKWLVTVLREETVLSEHEIPFSDTASTAGLLSGTAEPAHVILQETSIPATRVRITAGSNHSIAAVLEGEVDCGGRQLSGDYNRIDWQPLTIGCCTVKIGFRN